MPNVEVIDTSVVESKTTDMISRASALIVTSDDQLADAADQIKMVKLLAKSIRSEMERYTKPAQEIINNARLRFLPLEKRCQDVEQILKSKANAFLCHKEASRIVREEKIDAALVSGKIKEPTAIKRLEALGDQQSSITTTNGNRLVQKTVREMVITNRDLIPDEYWIIDEVKLRKVVLAGVNVPGTEVRETKQMAIS